MYFFVSYVDFMCIYVCSKAYAMVNTWRLEDTL